MNTQPNPHVVNNLNAFGHCRYQGASEYHTAMPHAPVHRPLATRARTQFRTLSVHYKTRYCNTVRCTGVGCTFAHSPEELKLGLNAQQHPNKKLCRYGEKCRRGTHCKFIHPQPIRGTACRTSTPAETECHYFLPLFMLESGNFSRLM